MEFLCPQNRKPPNCSQIRPIENVRAILKQKVYEDMARDKKIEKKIERCMKSLGADVFRNLMENIPQKLDNLQNLGYFLLIKTYLCR